MDKQEQLERNPAPAPLIEDIPVMADWLAGCMNASGYPLDYSLESFRELDRFFGEQSRPGGVLADGHPGSKLFAAGSYVGQVFVRQLGGVWETNDEDPEGEINIAVRLPDGSVVWPVQRAIKRLLNGEEDGFHVYGQFVAGRLKEISDS